jgi:hypothetical protein
MRQQNDSIRRENVERLDWHVRRKRVSETPLRTGASFVSEPLPDFRLLTTIPH